MNAIWENGVHLRQYPQLDHDLRTDVLIIGGGMAGLLCAWNLTRAGVDCTLIEKERLLSGVSGRTTAKITSQHGLIYDKLLRTLGPERAKLYWQANEAALGVYRDLAETAECDFSIQYSYLYSTSDIKPLEAELSALESLGIPAAWKSGLNLPFPVTGAICFPDQGQFHPMKFAAHISEGLRIYENTKAISFVGNQVKTPGGTITAEKVIVATHFPLLNKHGAYFLKLYQQRSYVIALENAKPVEGMYLDIARNGLSLRDAGGLLLLGGGGHRTGKQGMGWALTEGAAEQYYPQAKSVARWATQDCMTLDGVPYIGQYSKGTPDLYVATGFQKWGMTSSMATALLLTDLIRGRENPCADLFSPSRSMMTSQFFINSAESTFNLLRPTRPRCPHLGCALRWNKQEHSWDCPCHGSRFDSHGKLLNNPATDDLKAPPPGAQ